MKKYTVETPYPYKFYPAKTLNEAKAKKAELRKKGIKANIVGVTDDGRDYIVE